jgi:hypothetical protein
MCVLCSNAKLNQYKEQLFLPGVYKEVLEIAGLLNSSWVCSLDAEEGRTETCCGRPEQFGVLLSSEWMNVIFYMVETSFFAAVWRFHGRHQTCFFFLFVIFLSLLPVCLRWSVSNLFRSVCRG